MAKRKINIIDISVILIIAILIFASTIKFRNYNETDDVNSKIDNIVYDVRISGIRNYTVDAFEIGDILYDTQTNVEIGKIINKVSNKTKVYEKIKSGEMVEVEIPNRYDMILTMETTGTINETGYFANRSVELKVGSEKIVETLYAKSTGTIIRISENEGME